MPLKSRDVESALTKKGFKKTEGDHHIYFLWHNGKKTAVRTKISHNVADIHDRDCGYIARQMKITGPQFKNFVDCRLEAAAYCQILLDAKIIE